MLDQLFRQPMIWICSLFCGLFLVSACGDDEQEPKSFLSSYRVLALRAEPAQLSLNASSVLSLYDFHPNDLTADRPNISYSWRICPFSLGSVTQYQCFADEISIDEISQLNLSPERGLASSAIELNPAALFAEFGDDLQNQMEQLEMGSGMLGSEMNFFESGIFEIYVKLTVDIEDEPSFEAVKTMTVLFDSEIKVNQHPEILNVTSSPLLNEDATFKIEDEIEISIEASPDSAEEYQAPQSASDKEQGIEPEQKNEMPFVYYYTTSGRFDGGVKLLEENQVTLTLGDEPGAHKLFVVLRDGRGGVDLRSFNFKVEE